MPRPADPAQALGDPLHGNVGLIVLRVEVFVTGGKEDIHPRLLGQLTVPLKVAGVFFEILPDPELQGVDEQTDYQLIGHFPAVVHQI